MIQASGAIGCFDSGLGGLSVVQDIRKLMPNEDLIYYADSGRAPWGPRPSHQIIEFSKQIAQFLIQNGAKIIVVACNTASVNALEVLRATFPDIHFVGTVPAVKPAAQASSSKHIAAMVTRATSQEKAFHALLDQFVFAKNIRATIITPSGLVEQVEKGELDSPETQSILTETLRESLNSDADTLVLGCTHFPFLRRSIESITQGKMKIIDSGEAIAQQCKRVLESKNLLNQKATDTPTLKLYTSGDLVAVQSALDRLIGKSLALQLIFHALT